MDKADQRRRRERLSAESRRLLAQIDELHRLEERKRDERISTPAFHRLADTIKAKAAQVFRMTTLEERLGDRIDTGEVTLNDVAAHEAETGTGDNGKDREPAPG
jgi:hypothetical protein